jgi:hypothetical protein
VAAGKALGPGQVPDALSVSLAPLITGVGALPDLRPVAPTNRRRWPLPRTMPERYREFLRMLEDEDRWIPWYLPGAALPQPVRSP